SQVRPDSFFSTKNTPHSHSSLHHDPHSFAMATQLSHTTKNGYYPDLVNQDSNGADTSIVSHKLKGSPNRVSEGTQTTPAPSPTLHSQQQPQQERLQHLQNPYPTHIPPRTTSLTFKQHPHQPSSPPPSPQPHLKHEYNHPPSPSPPSRLSSLPQAQPNGIPLISSQHDQDLQSQRQTRKQSPEKQQPHNLRNHELPQQMVSLEPSPTLSAADISVASIATSVSSPASSVSNTAPANTHHILPALAVRPPADHSSDEDLDHLPSAQTNNLSSSSSSTKEALQSTVLSTSPLPLPSMEGATSGDLVSYSIDDTAPIGSLHQPPHALSGAKQELELEQGQGQEQEQEQEQAQERMQGQEQKLEQDATLKRSPIPPSAIQPVGVSSAQAGVIGVTEGYSAASSSKIHPLSSAPPVRASTMDVRKTRPGSQLLEDTGVSSSRQPQISQPDILNRARRRQIYRRNTYSADLGSTSIHRSDDEIEMDELEEARRRMEVLKRSSSRRMSRLRKDDDNDRVLIGTRIGEDHVNYVLMYNMLTGIRVS
ncbi:hypothetical protein BX616_005686, partial [Lobosporangium transversale]